MFDDDRRAKVHGRLAIGTGDSAASIRVYIYRMEDTDLLRGRLPMFKEAI